MHTDRELLEYAAKAAGIDGVWQDWDGMDIRYGFSQSIYSKDEGYWNPLDDDGDALRLAVKLEIDIAYRTKKVTALPCIQTQDLITEPWGNDPYAATRRAIVRAAAEIGKEMK